MARNKIKVYHYHFPISLLCGFRGHPDKSMNNIFDFALVAYKDAHHEKEDKAIEFDLGITLGGESIAETKKRMGNINKKQPYSHIHRDVFWKYTTRYRKGTNCDYPTDGETASLLCYLGLLSISGKVIDREVKTTKEMLFSRMSGNALPFDGSIENWLFQYMTRKRFDKLKRSVEDAFNIEFSKGHQRGVGFKVISY